MKILEKLTKQEADKLVETKNARFIKTIESPNEYLLYQGECFKKINEDYIPMKWTYRNYKYK